MEMQRTQSSHNLKKEENCQINTDVNIYYKAIVIKSVQYWHQDTPTD